MSNDKSGSDGLFSFVTLQSLLSDLSHVVALERLGPKLTQRVSWRARTDEPEIALTFDDGPNLDVTPKLLDVLDKQDVRASFFLIGKHLENHFSLARELVNAGHEVGNHTYSHQVLWRLVDAQISQEIIKTDELLKDLDGALPRFLRPPMGMFSKRILNIVEETGYHTVVGDVYPRDSHLPGKDRIVERTMRRVTNGSIIILHDGGNSGKVDRSQTLWAVERMIPMLKERGFQFVTLSELLF
ncbi:polysaccharide deacetylase family protein [bacterium]|nr:polysaccharide deacetylase family protein [bacterium]